MEYKDIIITTLLIIIPLILLILCYRSYVYKYCQDDINCLKNRLYIDIKNMKNKLVENTKSISDKDLDIENKNDTVEGFFSGFGTFFGGSSPKNLPVSPGSLNNENLNILENKINDRMKTSTTFPPTELNGNSDDFKDSDNSEILNQVSSKPLIVKKKSINPSVSSSIKQSISSQIKPSIELFEKENISEKEHIPKKDIQNLLGTCQFFNDKCPKNYQPLGHFSIQGVGSNATLACGDVQNVKPAHAIAQIKNNSIYEIHITDPGHGFNPSSPPKISIEGGKGHGATAEGVVDDNGYLKLIKVINPGYNYTETPNVLINAPFMNSSCHLCCKNEKL